MCNILVTFRYITNCVYFANAYGSPTMIISFSNADFSNNLNEGDFEKPLRSIV